MPAFVFPCLGSGQKVIKRDSVLALDSAFRSIEIKVNASAAGNRPGNGISKNAWGLTWEDIDGLPYRLILGWGNTDFGAFDDKRFMRITLMQGDSIAYSNDITDGVDLYKGSNFIKVKAPDDGQLEWSIGAVAVTLTGTLKMPAPPSPGSFRLMASGTDLKVNSLKITDLDRVPRALQTPYSQTSDFPEAETRTSSPEGTWVYLDRDNDPKWSVPGGRYTLGIKADGDKKWTIVYLEGATANAHRWKPGMKKGELKGTPFTSHYNLHWVDSSFQTLDDSDECSASLNADGSILTLSFPLDHATLRFYRP